MKTIELSDAEYNKLISLAKQHDEIYKVENWSFADLDSLREIGTEFIEVLKEKIKDMKYA
jgi:hypothetical protein